MYLGNNTCVRTCEWQTVSTEAKSIYLVTWVSVVPSHRSSCSITAPYILILDIIAIKIIRGFTTYTTHDGKFPGFLVAYCPTRFRILQLTVHHLHTFRSLLSVTFAQSSQSTPQDPILMHQAWHSTDVSLRRWPYARDQQSWSWRRFRRGRSFQ